MQTYDFGFDPGNSDAAAVCFAGLERIGQLAIPSVLADGTLADLLQIRHAAGTEHASRLRDEEYVLATGDSERYVGQLALTQSSDLFDSRGDISRYWSEGALALLLTLAGALIFDKEFALNVVTGLPAETYSTTNRRRVIEALSGDHVFFLNGQKRLAHVSVGKVLQEGASGIILYGSRNPVKQAVIDIGGRTTDLFVARGQEPIRDLCRGYDKGVEYAADLLSAQIMAAHHRRLDASERRAILRAHLMRDHGYPDIPVSGSSIPETDLAAWTESALRKTGALIASFVSKVLKNSEQGGVGTDLKSVTLIGGGAYYFLFDIRALMPFAEVRESPEYANALAYAYFARHAAQAAVKAVAS